MSRPAVITFLLVAIILVATAFFLLRPQHADAPGGRGPILDVDPARIVEIRIDRPTGSESARRERAGQWTITLPTPGGPPRSWPADLARIRAALRILSTLEFDRSGGDADPSAIPQSAPTVMISTEGSPRTLRLSDRVLAGKVLATAGRPQGAIIGWLGSDVRDMLITSGPREWRDAAALSITPDVSRITLRSHDSTVSLARIQGRWALRQPVQAPAEPESVVHLASAISSILITDFLDAGPPAAAKTGLDSPAAELTIESDIRDSDSAPARTVRQSLRAGNPADIASKGLFAALERTGPPRTVIVSASALASIKTDPAAYISRLASDAAAPDVFTVTIVADPAPPRAYQRTIDGWTTAGSPTRSPEPDAILKLLTQDRADTIAIADSWPLVWGHDSVGRPLATITLAGSDSSSVASIDLWTATLPGMNGREQVVAKSGSIWRAYPADATPRLLSALRPN